MLSRSWGNYPGLYSPDLNFGNPGNVSTFFAPHQRVNSTGLLPNDRPHVFKLSASRPWGGRLRTGFALTLGSGTPKNVFAVGPRGTFPINYAFVTPRGSAGRTPFLWDLDVRLVYDVGVQRGARLRLLIDVLNVGNPQQVVQVEELRYLSNVGGEFSNENPSFGAPVAFQRPMMGRFGGEVQF